MERDLDPSHPQERPMAVKAVFAIAAAAAVAIALLLPVPGGQTQARTSQFETVAVGQG
jgi:hypothetical protein